MSNRRSIVIVTAVKFDYTIPGVTIDNLYLYTFSMGVTTLHGVCNLTNSIILYYLKAKEEFKLFKVYYDCDIPTLF